MLKAIKVQIYPSEEQKVYISQQLGCCRFVYNSCLSYRINEYKNCNHSVSYNETDKYCNHVLKNDNPFLREVNSKVLQQSLRDLHKSYENFFRKKEGFPNFKKRGYRDSCRFPKDAFSGIKGNTVSLVKQLKDILFKCSERDEQYLNKHRDSVSSATLERTPSGKFFLSILVDFQPTARQAQGAVGIDLGIKSAVITSDGEIFENHHFAKNFVKQIAHLQKELSRKQKGSHNYERARIALAKVYEKVTNQRSWFLHQVTSVLTDENQVICMEDLNVKGMVKNHNLAASLQDISLGELSRILKYKCLFKGRTLVKIGRYFPSSKMCHHCGYVNRELKLSDREWICPHCGQHHDRDINAAVNILKEGLNLLSKTQVGASSPEFKRVEKPTVDDRRGNPLPKKQCFSEARSARIS